MPKAQLQEPAVNGSGVLSSEFAALLLACFLPPLLEAFGPASFKTWGAYAPLGAGLYAIARGAVKVARIWLLVKRPELVSLADSPNAQALSTGVVNMFQLSARVTGMAPTGSGDGQTVSLEIQSGADQLRNGQVYDLFVRQPGDTSQPPAQGAGAQGTTAQAGAASAQGAGVAGASGGASGGAQAGAGVTGQPASVAASAGQPGGTATAQPASAQPVTSGQALSGQATGQATGTATGQDHGTASAQTASAPAPASQGTTGGAQDGAQTFGAQAVIGGQRVTIMTTITPQGGASA